MQTTRYINNKNLAFLGWPYYILERKDWLYYTQCLISLDFFFLLLKGVYNTCAIHTQVNKQASVARILSAELFGIFSTSIKKALWDSQIKENNTKLSTTPNTYDESRNDTTTTPTAPQLQNLSHDYPLLLLPRNLRNIALANLITSRSNYPQSPTEHIITLQSNIDDT